MDQEKDKTQEPINRFTEFAKKAEPYISTSEKTYSDRLGNLFGNRDTTDSIHVYTKEEAEEIILDGSPDDLQSLSRSFYYANGFYRRLLVYYATILYYTPLLIPHMNKNKSKITEKRNEQKYFEALEFISSLNFEQLCRHFSLKVLTDGAYFGFLRKAGDKYCVQDLPYKKCRSRWKSFDGVPVVELDLTWFDSMADDVRKATLKTFPNEVQKAYKAYKKNKASVWVKLPTNSGLYFTLYDNRPFFSTVIPAVINFNDYINLEKTKDQQELRSVIAQEIEHTANGDLILEPPEAQALHEGLKKIAQGNDNLDAITTYGKIKLMRVQEDDAAVKNNLEKIEKVFYSESGVSKQLFSADTNTSLERSIQNDICLMMMLANEYSIWLKGVVNSLFGDKKISFGVEILPVGQYNEKEYLSQTLNSAQYGYSFMIPSLAMGLEQGQLLDIKRLEIDLLDMQSILVPLRSSHTESGNQSDKEKAAESGQKTEEEVKQAESEGASKEESEQSEKTIKNKNSSGEDV